MSTNNPTPSTLDVSATVSTDGGAAIDERGFIYSHTGTPTIEENEGIDDPAFPETKSINKLLTTK